tara:strand:- start:4840 stop:5073 length:234 start_codon:yes stop_codon:yes gene_type:complete
MGKMKEIFMEMVEKEYNGDHDAYIQDLARQTCEEFIKDEDTMCPNCNNPALERNETEARCINCGQAYVWVGSALRFK